MYLQVYEMSLCCPNVIVQIYTPASSMKAPIQTHPPQQETKPFPFNESYQACCVAFTLTTVEIGLPNSKQLTKS